LDDFHGDQSGNGDSISPGGLDPSNHESEYSIFFQVPAGLQRYPASLIFSAIVPLLVFSSRHPLILPCPAAA
jgi:hypothetical protein